MFWILQWKGRKYWGARYLRVGRRCFAKAAFSKWAFPPHCDTQRGLLVSQYIFEAFVFICNNSLSWNLYVTGFAKIKNILIIRNILWIQSKDYGVSYPWLYFSISELCLAALNLKPALVFYISESLEYCNHLSTQRQELTFLYTCHVSSEVIPGYTIKTQRHILNVVVFSLLFIDMQMLSKDYSHFG